MRIYKIIRCFLHQKRNRILLLISCLAFVISSYYMYSFEGKEVINNCGGLYLYYVMQNATISIVYFLILCYVTSNAYAVNFFENKKNKFNYLEIQRTGYKKYIMNAIFENFIVIAFIFVFLHIFILLFINYAIEPLWHPNNLMASITQLITQDQFTNLVLYLILSLIGMIVFSNLIFLLRYFVKNIHLYKVLGLVIGIILYILPAFIGTRFEQPIIRLILFLPFIGNILIPGLESFLIGNIHPIIPYVGSILLFITIEVLLFIFIYKKEHMYE